MDESETALIKAAQAGDRNAFSRVVERHYTLMFKTAWQFCGNREDAEDIAQESAIKLARNIESFRFESAFTTWIYRLVLNTAKDYFKAKNLRNGREGTLYDDIQYISQEPSPEQKLSDKQLVRAIYNLPDTLKETVILVCWQGLSHKEASLALKCSEGTISWRIHEARRKIKETSEGIVATPKKNFFLFMFLQLLLFISAYFAWGIQRGIAITVGDAGEGSNHKRMQNCEFYDICPTFVDKHPTALVIVAIASVVIVMSAIIIRKRKKKKAQQEARHDGA